MFRLINRSRDSFEMVRAAHFPFASVLPVHYVTLDHCEDLRARHKLSTEWRTLGGRSS
jgi:hypothetical protein